MKQSPHDEIEPMCLQNKVPTTQKKTNTTPSDKNEGRRAKITKFAIKLSCLDHQRKRKTRYRRRYLHDKVTVEKNFWLDFDLL